MTKEEAKEILQEYRNKLSNSVSNQLDEDIKAFDMAIKALKQEPVLDKIRSKIEREIIPRNSYKYDYEAKWQNLGLRMALKVINKYKVESEDK